VIEYPGGTTCFYLDWAAIIYCSWMMVGMVAEMICDLYEIFFGPRQ
jgi:hypothetical protein